MPEFHAILSGVSLGVILQTQHMGEGALAFPLEVGISCFAPEKDVDGLHSMGL